MIHKKTFVSADLDGNYQLTYAHNLNTEDISNPSWKDENGVYRPIGDLFQVVDSNTVILSCNGDVTGTQTLYFEYDAEASALSGKRLFEQPTTTDPVTTMRIAIGKSNIQTLNMTIAGLKAYLLSTLGFLKASNNLSDVNSVTGARSNLGVYSAVDVDKKLATKATLLQSASGYALGTSNTTIYTPSSDYHPSTKIYTDNNFVKPLLRGYYHVGDPTGGLQSITVPIPSVGTQNYIVIGTWIDNVGSLISIPIWKTRDHQTTSFKLDYAEEGSGANDLYFYFTLVSGTFYTDYTPT